MTTKTRVLLNPAPPQQAHCTLILEDGSSVTGWRVFDHVLGRSRYWTWSLDAPRPSNFTSAWQKAGVLEVFPVAWNPLPKVKVAAPNNPIARREAEIMLHRAILFDGTVRKRSDPHAIESSWDSSFHDNSLSMIDQVGLEIFARFVPEPFDGDNYLIGMSWFAKLNKKFNGVHYNREQRVVTWRAYGYSFEWMGDRNRLDVSRQRVTDIYKRSVDRVWELALADQGEVRRIPRPLWQD